MRRTGDTIGSLIRQARTEKEMTQQELADRMLLHPSAIGNIEKDRFVPAEGTLLNLAVFLELPSETRDKLLLLKRECDIKKAKARVARVMGLPVDSQNIPTPEIISLEKSALAPYFREIIEIISVDPDSQEHVKGSLRSLINLLRRH